MNNFEFEKEPINIIPIGYVESPILEEQDENWGQVESIIHLDPCFGSGLQGLEEFSHVIVIFYMHKASFQSERDLIQRPRGRMDMPEFRNLCPTCKTSPQSNWNNNGEDS